MAPAFLHRSATLALLLRAAPAVSRYEPFDFPAECASTEYFDISSLTCIACPTDQQPDASGLDCECSGDLIFRVSEGCVSCTSNTTGTVPNADRTACIPCTIDFGNLTDPSYDAPIGFDGGTCVCPAGTVLVDGFAPDADGVLVAAKRCRPCPTGTLDTGAGECTACAAEHQVPSGGACVCDTDYVAFTISSGFWDQTVACVTTEANTQYAATAAAGLSMRYLDLPVTPRSSSAPLDAVRSLPIAVGGLLNPLQRRRSRDTSTGAPPRRALSVCLRVHFTSTAVGWANTSTLAHCGHRARASLPRRVSFVPRARVAAAPASRSCARCPYGRVSLRHAVSVAPGVVTSTRTM